MKTGSFTPKPGDLFQFHYDKDDIKYCKTLMWSSTMKKRIKLNSGSLLLLVSITKNKISWMNGGTYIHASIDDLRVLPVVFDVNDEYIHPRKIE